MNTKKEHRDLGPLPIGGADVPLHERVGDRERHHEHEDRQHVTQPVANREGEATHERRHQGIPDEDLGQREKLP
jgi:hypothetical protein